MKPVGNTGQRQAAIINGNHRDIQIRCRRHIMISNDRNSTICNGITDKPVAIFGCAFDRNKNISCANLARVTTHAQNNRIFYMLMISIQQIRKMHVAPLLVQVRVNQALNSGEFLALFRQQDERQA